MRWWFHICKQNRCGNHQLRMRVPPHAKTLMPWRSVKPVMAKVRVKEKMAQERRARTAKMGKTKTATTAEKVAKTLTAKTDAPSAGKQAIRRRSVGSIRKAKKRAEGRSPFQQSLRVTHPRLFLLGPRHLKWEEAVASSLSHPRRNTNNRKVLARSGNTGFSWSRPSKSCRAASRALSPL